MKNYPVLTDVDVADNYCLILTFGENEKRLYNFKPNLNHKYYKPLTNKNLFNSVFVSDGEIGWVTGQDFCPHTLYEDSVPIELSSIPSTKKVYSTESKEAYSAVASEPLIPYRNTDE